MAEPWSEDPNAPSPVAPLDYVQRARAESTAVFARLTHEGRRILELAEDEARSGDSDHVGTEHIVLGMIAHEASTAGNVLRSVGITREVFLAQLYEEDGHSPSGPIPLTPRALMIVALAGRATDGAVTGLHLLSGVIEESDLWRAMGRPGPHHLAKACEAVGFAWAEFGRTVSDQLERS